MLLCSNTWDACLFVLYIDVYVSRVCSAGCEYVDNEAKQSGTQLMIMSDLIHNLTGINPSSCERN